jgi:hypothetical protein
MLSELWRTPPSPGVTPAGKTLPLLLIRLPSSAVLSAAAGETVEASSKALEGARRH